MKGTFFSADFVKDHNSNLRLLELNTDTTVVTSAINSLDWSSFITTLDNNNITEVAVVYKPYIHEEVVDHLSSSLNASASFIDTFTKVEESLYSIYPTSPDDADNKFILRLAYNEGAILDSSYCKSNINTLKLFSDASSGSYCVGYYYSSSADGVVDTLDKVTYADNVPDVVRKSTIEATGRNNVAFFKIGSGSGANDTARWDNFINHYKNEWYILEQFHYDSSNVANNKVYSYRSFNIVYGSDLTTIPVLNYKVQPFFEIPSSLNYDRDSFQNPISKQHFFEYATNFIKFGRNGLYESHSIIKSDDTSTTLQNIAVGDNIKSYFVSGSPQVEVDYAVKAWSHPGSSLPSGSYVTSSVVVFRDSNPILHGSLVELVVDGDKLYTGTGKQFLIYDSGSDNIRFELAGYLDKDNHYLLDLNGGTIDIDEANLYTTPDDINLVEIDVEDTDTYIISGSTAFNGAVSHNAPCFVEGTLITCKDSFKKIEDVKVGEIVLTYNHDSFSNEWKQVLETTSREDQTVVSYYFNEKELTATLDHPIYTINKGYASYNPVLTKEMYGMDVKKIEVGDTLLTPDKDDLTITNIQVNETKRKVYNLKSVADNSNFFAENVLVHNRCFVAGTEVKLSNGDSKNIEDIIPGDNVISFNEDTKKKESGEVTEIHQFSSTHLIEIELADGNKITSTDDHPYYVDGYKLASFDPDSTNADYDLPDNVEQLNVGDFVYNFEGDLIEIISIEELEDEKTTYIITVDGNHNFYANSILVHNK